MRIFLALVALAAALPAGAQAPVVTSAGDPSVRSDTIYKLAVKAADHPDEAVVVLLDDGIVRREADGRGTHTFRQVVQILKEEAVEDLREHRFSYSPGHEKMTINWIRVVKPDGTVISDAPTHVQDSDIPAKMGNPVYSDRKVKRVSLTGVEIGTIVDFSVTTEEMQPYHAGDFLETWRINTGTRIMRSRYVLDLPSTMKPRIQEWNVATPHTTQQMHGRTVYTWSAHDMDRVKNEVFAADSNKVLSHIAVGAPITWASVAQWYAENAKDRYVASPALAKKVQEVVTGATTRQDSIRAIHRWVAQDIRYVSIALGMGGYQPRMPDTAFATGFGDCKDKATLFITALKQIGVTAYPVLLSSDGGILRNVPSYMQFDHVIAAVKEPVGYQYVDLTATTQPYGPVMSDYQGEFGLVVFPDGKSEEITFPQNTAHDNMDSTTIVGTVSPDGYFTGKYTEIVRGMVSEAIRGMFETPFDSTQRANFAKALARRYFENATGDSLQSFDGKDLRAEPVFAINIKHGKAATPAGTSMILSLPPGSGAAARASADEMDALPPRMFPIDAARVYGPRIDIIEYRITLPDGWHAKLPESVRAESPFGAYVAEYTQDGSVLRVRRTMSGTRGVFAPERMSELVAWFRAIGKDDAKFIVLEKNSQ